MEKKLQTAITIRKFNRCYLSYFHLLSQKYLNSQYSMADARILYEIYENSQICARDIVRNLHVDKSYLSRTLKKFETELLIERKQAENHAHLLIITLTGKGKKLTESLIEESNYQIMQDLAELSKEDLDELSDHLAQITEILGGNEK